MFNSLANESSVLDDEEQLFFDSYIKAIYFTEHDKVPTWAKNSVELDFESTRQAAIDCLSAYSKMKAYLKPESIEQAGYDFWLTRNGHGTGFWDRPEIYGDTYSQMFTEISEFFNVPATPISFELFDSKGLRTNHFS